MKIITRLLIILCVITSLVTNAQKSKAPTIPQPTINAEQFKGLKWRNIGPYRGGRSNAVSGLTNNDQVYFTGYTGGGLWKTEDAGISWKNISDGFFKTGTVGDIAISESDPNVIYVGMGEHAVRGVMTSYGDGIYKSVDGGKTWKNIGLEKTRHIADVVVHPTNSDIVLVAAQGALHGNSVDRGVYKSVDGGTTWKKVLYIGEGTGASSLSMDMTNPRILYAATWQHRRYPWKVESGGSGSSIWKSVDGGDTWSKIDEGLPKEVGKIGVSVSRANPNRVYAIVEAEKSKAGLYRSDDGGKKWNHLTNDQNITSRSWYYMEVFADPIKEDWVYVLNAPMMRSIDGGRTFENISIAHGDCHDLWINPKNSNNLILGDDGGGSITYDGCKSWSTLNNQPTSQFYRVNVDNLFPFRVYGGQQDNSSVVIKSRNNSYGLTERDWFDGPGCESAYIAFNPNDPTLLYGGCYQGNITVLDLRTNEHKDIMKYPSTNLSYKAKDMKYRFNWNAPLITSPHDPSTIYHAANVVLKTTNGGISWEEVSPDLTRNDTTKQQLGGGPITNEGAGGENYNTIYYLIESPHEKGVLYAGSDCGLVHITKDGGKSWQNITPAGLPESMVQSIEVSPHDKATVYISASRYKFNDFSSLTFKSTDYGKTWTRISTGVDVDDFIKVIREDKKVKDLLYAGSERGFYLSTNGGLTWNKFQLNLPVVPVTDLIFQGNDLVASTAGRSFWILDDVSAVQQSRGNFGTAAVKLFQPKPTVRYPGVTLPEAAGSAPGFGVNPLDGVVLDYYLKEKADTNKVTLDILDGSGKIIRSFSNKKNENFKPFAGGPPPPQVIPAEAGVNRFAWDIRTETLKEISNAYVFGDYRGHRVAPGKYKARMTYKGETSETEFELIQDPNLKVTTQDWNAQQQFMLEVESKIEEMHTAVNTLRNVKKQIGSYNEMLNGRADAADVVNAGKELIKKIDQWESNIVQTKQKNFQDVINFPSKLNTEYFAIRGVIDTHDPRVTQGALDRFNDLEKQWGAYKEQMKNLISGDIAAYNNLFKNKNIPALLTKD